MAHTGSASKKISRTPTLTLVSVLYLGTLVGLPVLALAYTALHVDGAAWARLFSDTRTRAALQLSVGASIIAAVCAAPIGFLIAWVLERYDFHGRRFLDALVDVPFAMPTAVSGIALATLAAPTGWLGRVFMWFNIHLAYSRLGVVFALVFVAVPLIVRTVQPVLLDLPDELEEAARSLGASGWQIFRRVHFPLTLPALLSGVSLGFARAVGEYGSVIFLAGNLPHRTEIAPLLTLIKLEEYDEKGAAALACALLGLSLAVLSLFYLASSWARRNAGETHGETHDA